MLFFEAQQNAKEKTRMLVGFFLLKATFLSLINTIIIKVFFLNSGFLSSILPRIQFKDTNLFSFLFQNYSSATQMFAAAIYSWEAKIFFGNILFFALFALYYLNKYQNGSSVAIALGGTRIDNFRNNLIQTPLEPKEKVLLNIVEEMSIASGVRIPEVYVLKYDMTINAFAAGGSAKHSVIAVTQGALNLLDRSELQAVIGHEFSHILNEDIQLNTKLTSVVMGFHMIHRLGVVMVRGNRSKIRALSVTPSGKKGKSGGGAGVFTLFALFIMITGYLGYILGRWLQAKISREREFLADASSAQFTRYPEALALALSKVAVGGGSHIISPFKDEHSHIFFANSLDQTRWDFFASHPPLEERIRRLMPKSKPEDLYDMAMQKLKGVDIKMSPIPEVMAAPAKESVRSPMKKAALTLPVLNHLSGLINSESLDLSHSLMSEISIFYDEVHDVNFAKAALLLCLLKTQQGYSEIAHTIMTNSFEHQKKLQDLALQLQNNSDLLEIVLHLSLKTLQEASRTEKIDVLNVLKKFYDSDKKITLIEALYLFLIEDRFELKIQKKRGFFSLTEAKNQFILFLQKPDHVAQVTLDEIIFSFRRASRMSLMYHLDELWEGHSHSRARELRAFFMILSIPLPLNVQATRPN